jgi:hypothetical protein
LSIIGIFTKEYNFEAAITANNKYFQW